jgi:hypothetical protein
MKALSLTKYRLCAPLLPHLPPWHDADDGMASSDAPMMALALVRVNDAVGASAYPRTPKNGARRDTPNTVPGRCDSAKVHPYRV